MNQLKSKQFSRVAAVLGVALASLAVNRPAVADTDKSKEKRSDDVRVAVLINLIQPKAGENRVVFISVDNKDPKPEFLNRLSGYQLQAKPASESKMVDGKVTDPTTGKPSAIFQVSALKWVGDSKAILDGGYVFANLGAEGNEYEVEWNGAHWIVKKTTAKWVS